LGDPYADPPFFVDDKVTLSTIYRAKGNEAPAVIAVGIDGVTAWSRNGRNKIFTAFTRAKVWLRVSGVGQAASSFITEIGMALSKMPRLEFVMPDLEQVNFIQRDLTQKQAEVKRIREEYLARLRDQGLSEEQAIEFLDEDRRGSSRV
jgi:superfamily I DNA and RNA helicase